MTRRIILLVALYILVIVVFAWLRPREIDWRPSFSPDKAIPFATRILYQELHTVRTETLRQSARPVFNTVRDLEETGSEHLYFFLNRRFEPDALDLATLLEFAETGNSVFIASEHFPIELLDTLGIYLHVGYLGSFNMAEWFYEDNINLSLLSRPGEQWPAATGSGYRWFESIDSSALDTLGAVDDIYPNFIACPFGEGTVYLHAFPYIFTNYHMLYQNNHRYVSAALAEIPSVDDWIWDRYYTEDYLNTAKTPLAVFNRYRSFRWAYWTGIAAIAIFILFTAKRRQRIIPLLPPRRNRTLDFVRTIGDLYFHRADHHDLIKKKIEILRAQVQKRFRVDVHAFTHAEALAVSGRSGIHPDIVQQLFTRIRSLTGQEHVQISDLRALQQDLDLFFRRS